MRRLRILFAVFAVALIAPLGLLVHRALASLALERQMRHQAVAERIFDEMERALSRLLEAEEDTPFDRYGIEESPEEPPCVIGRFQIDPDGEIHGLPTEIDDEAVEVVAEYWGADQAEQELPPAGGTKAQLPGTTVEMKEKGNLEVRGLIEEQRAAKSDDVSAFSALRSLNKGVTERADRQQKLAAAPRSEPADSPPKAAYLDAPAGARDRVIWAERSPPADFDSAGALAESDSAQPRRRVAAPLPSAMTARVVDEEHLVLVRTVARETGTYRQGVLLDLDGLGSWLEDAALPNDALREQVQVEFANPFLVLPESDAGAAFVYRHRFAEPFDSLSAKLELAPLPGIGTGNYVYALSGLLLVSTLVGLGSLYRMVSVAIGYAERRSNFVAAVSHELKTPLTAIRMYGEMLRDGIVPSEEKRNEYYRHITVESERLSRLINNVLELSRLEKGNRDVALTVASPAPVVREVADLLGPHARERGFELDVRIEENLPAARFERDALVQVLCNLVDNAVKYAGDSADKRIELFSRRSGDRVSVGVRDSGPGVPARHLDKIFEPFYRGESELIRKSKGVGLGLALVRGLAERMGAEVCGRNAAGGGFEVEVALRAA